MDVRPVPVYGPSSTPFWCLAMSDPEVLEALTRLETQSKATHQLVRDLGNAFTAHDKENHDDFGEVHRRVNAVEKKQSWMIGVATGIGTVIGGMIVLVKEVLTKN